MNAEPELRYVYAVCRPFGTPLPAQLTGVGGAPVARLAHEGLVAVVSDVPERDFAQEPLRAHLEDLDWLSDTARAHQAVIAALTTVTCPVPLRLATVFHDDSGVRAMLEDEADRFRHVLERIDGCVEWGVKVHLESAGAAADAARSPGRSAQPASGRDYLKRRKAQHAAREEGWERAEAFARQLHGELAGHAADSRLHAPQHPALSPGSGRNVLNAAYLVPRSVSEEFVERVDRAAKGEPPGLRVELTGPWAAYSFTGGQEQQGQSGQSGQSEQSWQPERGGADA